jgi:hypothetical protein
VVSPDIMHALLNSGSFVSSRVEMKTVLCKLNGLELIQTGDLLDPADSPNAVTLLGSPPNPDMLFFTYIN